MFPSIFMIFFLSSVYSLFIYNHQKYMSTYITMKTIHFLKKKYSISSQMLLYIQQSVLHI